MFNTIPEMNSTIRISQKRGIKHISMTISKKVIHFNNPRWLPAAILNYKKASRETFRDSSDFKSRPFQVTFLKISAFINFIRGLC